jgi:hypothetical protein
MVERIEVQLNASGDGGEYRALRPHSIFRNTAEVDEADRLHSELEKNGGMVNNAGVDKEWEVVRTVKHESNGTEFEIRFGFNFTRRAHMLRLRVMRY